MRLFRKKDPKPEPVCGSLPPTTATVPMPPVKPPREPKGWTIHDEIEHQALFREILANKAMPQVPVADPRTGLVPSGFSVYRKGDGGPVVHGHIRGHPIPQNAQITSTDEHAVHYQVP